MESSTKTISGMHTRARTLAQAREHKYTSISSFSVNYASFPVNYIWHRQQRDHFTQPGLNVTLGLNVTHVTHVTCVLSQDLYQDLVPKRESLPRGGLQRLDAWEGAASASRA